MALQVPRDPSHQLSTLRPLAASLYDSTCRSSALSQAQNELGLLVALLSATEAYSSLLCTDYSRPALTTTLQHCHSGLVDLQRLQRSPRERGLENLISNICARFSSLIFELSVMNADMTISSQHNVDRLVRGFIDDIHAGERDASVVSSLLSGSSATEKDNAWEQLQRDLHELGISPDLSSQDRTFIISTLQKAVDREDLLKNTRQQSMASNGPTTSIRQHHAQSTNASHASSTAPVPPGDPDHSDKEAIWAANLPIPVATELQGPADWAKQAMPVDNLPIPVRSEIPFTSDDSDKQALRPDTYPIPVATETSSETRSNSSSAASNAPSVQMSRGKKPSIVSRMKFKLTSNKDEFISLIQMGGMYSVKIALDKGADPNTFNVQGHTALMVAVSFGHESVVELLLEYGALPDKVSNRGDTALGAAALRGYEGIVYKLLARGASVDAARKVGKTALSQAAETGQEKIAREFLNRGADVNAVCHTGDTALSQAAHSGHISLVRLLLDCGAQVDHAAYPRKTPLYKAVEQNRLEVAKLLMERGADPTREESVRGRSPLSLAFTYGRGEILTLFKQYGHDTTSYQFY
ncbi:hypothetical protein N7492_002347 [Penicillium capsulatum]|uniref:Ankyrin repeat protein n=1 Tax=Penicillium capsulatum TaxID=69766 RepID=A0A9W9LWB9_9EURO|nr:hypothetical protein N7492_002347 [Penicillium capsulatum]KAJ6123047.1 hypothetical protein N7512_005512 [Penicillium capsulatum]